MPRTKSGTSQVFVRSFPDPNLAKYQVSANGGNHPRWRRDGSELYFVEAGRRVVAVDVTHGSGLSFDKPTVLFDASTDMDAGGALTGASPFDVSADGQRFIIVAPRGGTSTVSLTVAVNWMADLKPARP
jgi:Tol biopolymer transport system component